MEIERKYLVKEVPANLESYPFKELEQAYLNSNPTVRIRKEDEEYYLTYKGKGFLAREEYNLPLNKESYYHLLDKKDGRVISKRRYLIPLGKLTIELDIFKGDLAPLKYAEVEFETEEEALSFTPPEWFVEDVTYDPSYSNVALSRI